MPKIESENKFLTSINGYNSVLFCQNLPIRSSAIPEHSFTILTLIPSLKNIGKGMPEIESENQFQTSIKGRNSVLICQNLPICNSRTLLPNTNSHSKFEENWLKMLPAESGNGRTDGHSYSWILLRYLQC